MATEKRIFTLTLIVLLSVFLSFNTVLPCWVLGQCSRREEGFQEGAIPAVGQLSSLLDKSQPRVKAALDDVVKNKPQCFNNITGEFDRKCVLEEGDAKILVSNTILGSLAVSELKTRYNKAKEESGNKAISAQPTIVAKAPGPQPKLKK